MVFYQCNSGMYYVTELFNSKYFYKNKSDQIFSESLDYCITKQSGYYLLKSVSF